MSTDYRVLAIQQVELSVYKPNELYSGSTSRNSGNCNTFLQKHKASATEALSVCAANFAFIFCCCHYICRSFNLLPICRPSSVISAGQQCSPTLFLDRHYLGTISQHIPHEFEHVACIEKCNYLLIFIFWVCETTLHINSIKSASQVGKCVTIGMTPVKRQ